MVWQILGSGMSNKMWEALIEHAKTCVLSGNLYIYYPDETRSVGVVFNNIYELSGLIVNDQYYPADSLSDSQKVRGFLLIWVYLVEEFTCLQCMSIPDILRHNSPFLWSNNEIKLTKSCYP